VTRDIGSAEHWKTFMQFSWNQYHAGECLLDVTRYL